MRLRVIKDEAGHAEALERLDQLMMLNPASGTAEADELEILAVLLEDYEKQHHPIAAPSPVEAILFRMEQAGLTQRDLVPFFGSRSKVSEVLSGKRPLTLSTIRALSDGLGIPLDVLVQDSPEKPSEGANGLVLRLPSREIVARRWVEPGPDESPDEAVSRWISSIPAEQYLQAARKTRHVRSAKKSDDGALYAWTARVIEVTSASPCTAAYEPGTVDATFMQQLVKLSADERGPVLARDELDRHGICMIVERHLPRTYLDGAAIWTDCGPVVSLTLRHDRLDNFWFTLMHELAHLRQMESGTDISGFYDDLDSPDRDALEVEADQLASEALIPEAAWVASAVSRLRSPDAVHLLADELGISPAIVAGRVRREYGDYRVLSRLVGAGEVRAQFEG